MCCGVPEVQNKPANELFSPERLWARIAHRLMQWGCRGGWGVCALVCVCVGGWRGCGGGRGVTVWGCLRFHVADAAAGMVITERRAGVWDLGRFVRCAINVFILILNSAELVWTKARFHLFSVCGDRRSCKSLRQVPGLPWSFPNIDASVKSLTAVTAPARPAEPRWRGTAGRRLARGQKGRRIHLRPAGQGSKGTGGAGGPLH